MSAISKARAYLEALKKPSAPPSASVTVSADPTADQASGADAHATVAIAPPTDPRDAEIAALKASIAELKTENTGLHAEIMSLEDQLNQADAAIAEFSDLETRIAELEDRNAKQDFHIENQNEQIEKQNEQIAFLHHWIAQQDYNMGILFSMNCTLLFYMIPRVVRIQRSVRAFLARRKHATAITIQKVVRARLAHRSVANLREQHTQRIRACTAIQRIARGNYIRHRIREEEIARRRSFLLAMVESENPCELGVSNDDIHKFIFTFAPADEPDTTAHVVPNAPTPEVGSNDWIVARMLEILRANPDAVATLEKHHDAFAQIPVKHICGSCFAFITDNRDKKKAQAALLEAIVSDKIAEYVKKCEHRRMLVGLPGKPGALDHFLSYYPKKLKSVSDAIWYQKNQLRKSVTPKQAPTTNPGKKPVAPPPAAGATPVGIRVVDLTQWPPVEKA